MASSKKSKWRLQPQSFCAVASAVGCSTIACSLFLLAAAVTSWDFVQFDFAKVNASASASAEFVSVRLLQSTEKAVVGAVLLTSNTTGFCLLNLRAGLWLLCDDVDVDAPSNSAYHTHCPQLDAVIGNGSCFSYITDYSSVRQLLETTAYTSESQIMKMQNNIVSCCIVVLLCILASVVTCIIGVCCRVVPAIMVTGVLFLTAGIFVIFGNSIMHEKLARMTRKPQIANCPQCVCYSMVKTPEQFCSSDYRSVYAGWALAVSWISAGVFMAAAALWFWFTRRLRIEKSKMMI